MKARALRRETAEAPTARLRIDPAACDGVGICAHLAPHLITVDSWGYPIIDATEVSGRELRAATTAVNACPRRALYLQAD